MKITPIEFRNNLKLTLRGFVHEPKRYETAVLYLHGFPGSMMSGAMRMCKALSHNGYLSMRFEFSGTNTSEGKFENKLMSQEIKDVKYAIDFLEKNYSFKKLILIGHSTGAIDAALYSYKDSRITKVILSGAVSKLDEAARYDFTDIQIRDFWKKGYIMYTNPERWYHKQKLKKAFYDEFFTLNIPKAISKLHKPILIIHAQCDEAIPVNKDPHELLSFANRPKKLVIIKGADHRITQAKHFKKYLRVILEFIKK
jgi:uncharacterized protein